MGAVHTRLFVSERNHGINAHGASRRKAESKQRRCRENRRDKNKGYRLVGLNSVQEARQVASEASGPRDSDGEADQREGKSLAKNKLNDVTDPRDKRDPDTKFIASLVLRKF